MMGSNYDFLKKRKRIGRYTKNIYEKEYNQMISDKAEIAFDKLMWALEERRKY